MSDFIVTATYGLASLLAGESETESSKIQKILTKYSRERALQKLVQVNYDVIKSISGRDFRMFRSIEVLDVQILSRNE